MGLAVEGAMTPPAVRRRVPSWLRPHPSSELVEACEQALAVSDCPSPRGVTCNTAS